MNNLGDLLRRAAQAAGETAALALAPHGVTPAEWAVMRTLHAHGPAPPSVLADRLGLTRGAVTKLVDRLRAKALVVRARGAGDRRMQTIALTGAGAKLVPVLAEIADAAESATFAALPTARRATLATMLRTLDPASRLRDPGD